MHVWFWYAVGFLYTRLWKQCGIETNSFHDVGLSPMTCGSAHGCDVTMAFLSVAEMQVS